MTPVDVRSEATAHGGRAEPPGSLHATCARTPSRSGPPARLHATPLTLPSALAAPRRYTPDAFERDNVADGTKVSEWRNVANICYQGFQSTAAETSGGYDVANDCTYAKKSNSQAVPFGNTKHVEALKQDNPHHQPIYKKNVLNGHGVVRFRRHNKLGSDGQFLQMYKRCSDVKCTGDSAEAGFVPLVSGKEWYTTNAAAETQFTMFAVVKTYQTPGDVNPMGIVNLAKLSAQDGVGLYKIPSTCKPVVKSTIDAPAKFSLCDGTVGGHCHQVQLKTDTHFGKRSITPGAYNGMYLHFKQGTADVATQDKTTGLVCKIKQYLIVGYVSQDYTGAAVTEILLDGSGTAGYLSGIDMATQANKMG